MQAQTTTYSMPPAEAQLVILDWVKATEQFYQRYFQINEVINGLNRSRYSQPIKARTRTKTSGKENVRELLRLRQQMSDVLTTLMVDISTPKATRQMAPSKPGQLISHTRLLQELNRTVESELSRVTGAQA